MADLRGVPLNRSTLSGTLLTQLRQQILSGRLAPGDGLPTEREIGEAFGVGRTTVREALQGLQVSGFVRREGKRLVVVDKGALNPEDVDAAASGARLSVTEVFETRKLLEIEAIRLAAERHTEADLEQLWSVLDAMSVDDPEEYHRLDAEFHTLIIGMSKNSVLAAIYDASKYTYLFFRPPSFWRLFNQSGREKGAEIGGGRIGHEMLYNAIASGDPDKAARTMFEHLDRVQQALTKRITSPGSARPSGPAKKQPAKKQTSRKRSR